MSKTTDILLYIIVGLMSVVLLLAIVADIYGIINPSYVNPSYEYERGYMDGFRDGMLMNVDYGTVKLERKGGEE